MSNIASTTCSQLARISSAKGHELLSYLLTLASDAAALKANDPELDEAFTEFLGRTPKAAGVWHFDVDEDRMLLDPRTSAMCGIKHSVGAKGVTLAELFGRIHPDDRSHVAAAFKSALEVSGHYKAAYRLVVKKNVTWIVATGQCFFDNKKKPIRFPGTVFEVTEGDPLLSELKFRKRPTVRLR